MKYVMAIIGSLSLLGCGNFSNDDLLFLAAVPTANELELVMGDGAAVPNGLAVGDEAEYYTTAKNFANELNKGVGGLLDFVDSLGKGYPPTERSKDARIWGPIENIDKTGITLRLEIQRSEAEAGGPRYTFCLHMGEDEAARGAVVRCSREPTRDGLEPILWGHYDPRDASAGVRSGAGTIHLDFEGLHRLGGTKKNERGLFELEYDFSQGGDAKQIHIDWVGATSDDSAPETLQYDYGRALDGRIDFYLELALDVIAPESPWSTKERVSLDAFWYEGGTGRAEAIVQDGDLEPGKKAIGTECWDSAYRRTYFKLVVEQNAAWNSEEGDEAACPAG
jgi:hypothetical protein